MGLDQPKEVIEAQFSLRFSLALRLCEGNNDLRHYLDPAMWSNPVLLGIGKRIELCADPAAIGLRRFACRMTVELVDGRRFDGALDEPKGNYRNPLSADELQKKFLGLGDGALPRERLDEILVRASAIEMQDDIARLIELLSLSSAA